MTKKFTYRQIESKLNRAKNAIEQFDSEDPNDILNMSVEDYAHFRNYEIVEQNPYHRQISAIHSKALVNASSVIKPTPEEFIDDCIARAHEIFTVKSYEFTLQVYE